MGKMKIFSLCKKYLLSHKILLLLYIFLCLVSSLLSIMLPYLSGNFIDILISQRRKYFIYNFCILYGCIGTLKIILGYFCPLLYVKMQVEMGYELNKDIVFHVQNLSLTYIQRQDSVFLSQNINTDSNNLIIFCLTIIQNFLTNALMISIPFFIVLFISPRICIVNIVFLTIYIILYIIFRKPLYKHAFMFKESQSKFFTSLHQQLKKMKFTKLHSAEQVLHDKLKSDFCSLRLGVIEFQKINCLFNSLDNIVLTLSQISFYLLGGLQILAGELTIGMYTIFTTYFSMMINSIRYFFNIGKSYQEALVSYDRIINILNQKTETNGSVQIDKIDKIDIQNLSFSYGEKEIIKNLNMTFTKGKIYGIKGGNGTGKTTLINLLLGLYIDEKKGVVLYNGIDISKLDMKKIRRNLIGVSEQEPVMLNSTIDQNLTLSREPLNNYKLEKYIKLLHLEQCINKNGLDFVINDNSNISGGEKQKLSIIRVLLKEPDIMVFDEPTSALDMKSAKCFSDYLLKVRDNRIIIIITHESQLMEICDVIYNLDDNSKNEVSEDNSAINL